jgi:hypothetical protein
VDAITIAEVATRKVGYTLYSDYGRIGAWLISLLLQGLSFS